MTSTNKNQSVADLRRRGHVAHRIALFAAFTFTAAILWMAMIYSFSFFSSNPFGWTIWGYVAIAIASILIGVAAAIRSRQLLARVTVEAEAAGTPHWWEFRDVDWLVGYITELIEQIRSQSPDTALHIIMLALYPADIAPLTDAELCLQPVKWLVDATCAMPPVIRQLLIYAATADCPAKIDES